MSLDDAEITVRRSVESGIRLGYLSKALSKSGNGLKSKRYVGTYVTAMKRFMAMAVVCDSRYAGTSLMRSFPAIEAISFGPEIDLDVLFVCSVRLALDVREKWISQKFPAKEIRKLNRLIRRMHRTALKMSALIDRRQLPMKYQTINATS